MIPVVYYKFIEYCAKTLQKIKIDSYKILYRDVGSIICKYYLETEYRNLMNCKIMTAILSCYRNSCSSLMKIITNKKMRVKVVIVK